MTGLGAAALVARREVRQRLRSRELLVSTIVSLVLLAGLVLAAAGGDDGPSYEVGTVGERPAQVGVAMERLAGSGPEADRIAVTVRDVDDRAAGLALVRDGELDAVLVDGDLVVDDGAGPELAALAQAAGREVAIGEALGELGATPEDLAAAQAPPLRVDELGSADDATGLATVGTFVLYMQLFGLGYWVASGIVEEKSSRVIEVLLAKARPSALLAGKVVGIGVVGLGQLVLFVAVGLGLASATGAVEVPSGTGQATAVLIVSFLLGFALYACVFAMGGALASRAEDLQNSTGPITLVILGAFLAALSAARDPEGTVAEVATFLPPSAPLVVPIRTGAGAVAPWEMAVSAALVVATTVLIVRIAARVYAGGALVTRGRLGLRDALARAAD